MGTTVVRALETAIGPGGKIIHGRGSTGLLITPGHRFTIVDGIITNDVETAKKVLGRT